MLTWTFGRARLWAIWDDNAGWLRSWKSPGIYAGCWDSGAVRILFHFSKLSKLVRSITDVITKRVWHGTFGGQLTRELHKRRDCDIASHLCYPSDQTELLVKQWNFSWQLHPRLYRFQVCAVKKKKERVLRKSKTLSYTFSLTKQIVIKFTSWSTPCIKDRDKVMCAIKKQNKDKCILRCVLVW